MVSDGQGIWVRMLIKSCFVCISVYELNLSGSAIWWLFHALDPHFEARFHYISEHNVILDFLAMCTSNMLICCGRVVIYTLCCNATFAFVTNFLLLH